MRKGITLTLQTLLGLFMLYAAYTLFTWTPELITKSRDALNYPRWYWVLAGVLALISAIMLLVGLFIPVLGAFGALWTAAYFAVAIASHVYRADWANFSAPLIFFVISLVLVWLRWNDARPIRGAVGMA